MEYWQEPDKEAKVYTMVPNIAFGEAGEIRFFAVRNGCLTISLFENLSANIAVALDPDAAQMFKNWLNETL